MTFKGQTTVMPPIRMVTYNLHILPVTKFPHKAAWKGKTEGPRRLLRAVGSLRTNTIFTEMGNI